MIRKFKVPIYSSVLFVTDNHKDYLKTVRKYIKDFDAKETSGSEVFISNESNTIGFINVSNGSIKTLVHEIIHFCVDLLNFCGVNCKENSESLCYLVSYLFVLVCGTDYKFSMSKEVMLVCNKPKPGKPAKPKKL